MTESLKRFTIYKANWTNKANWNNWRKSPTPTLLEGCKIRSPVSGVWSPCGRKTEEADDTDKLEDDMNDKDPKVSKDYKDTKDELDIIQHNEHTNK